MRQYLLLIITLCLHIAARGQTIASLDDLDLSGLPKATAAKALRYWIDDDTGNAKTMNQMSGTHSLDVSLPTEGLHTLHCQVIDDMDAAASAYSAVFLKVGGLSEAKTAKQLRYWFDEEYASVNTASGTTGAYMIDAAMLTEGLHTLHYQVIDNTNAVTSALSAVFLKVGGLSEAKTAKQLRYWFDDEASAAETVAAASGVHTVDTKSLVGGLHTLHYLAVDNDGAVCSVGSGLFLKTEESGSDDTVTARKLMYWFDDEADIKTVDVASGVQMLDASTLTDGLHTIHYQVLCNNGQMTSALSSIFLRVNVDTEISPAKSLRFWFDGEQTAQETAIVAGVQTLDVSRLTEGLHTVHYQTVDDKGAMGIPVSSVFLKTDAQTAAAEAKSIRYWFDTDHASMKTIAVATGTQTLDVSGLLSGLHTLYYQLVDDNGKVGSPIAAIFMKAFDKVIEGGNRVMKYQYWLNSNSQAMQTVTLNNAANPYQLISLLPMQKEPIHSDCFQFEMTDGQPTIYAKNIFHIRFHDAAGYFSDGDKPFVDYSVKQVVTNAEQLNNGDHKDTARPVGNDIKWYRLTAEPGDSVQFRLDRAATVQLFAPSGEEILSASASDVVKWFGCHVRESGTYYVALHDVTATSGTTVGIDYEHIDKYAVLRQDVSVVGNGGCSTITFEGNGFRDLYAVDLFTAQGDSIHHVYIGHESDATTSVVFDFTDAVLGKYHAKFRFAEEDKTFNNIVTVEEAQEIDIATEIQYASTYLSGTLNPYSITLTNKGNMTAYDVPVVIGAFEENDGALSYIKVDGYSLSKMYDEVWKDSLPTALYDSLRYSTLEHGDMCYFIKIDNNMNGNGYPFAQYTSMFPEIPPYSSIHLSVSIKSSQTAMLYVWVANPNQTSPTVQLAKANKEPSKRWCDTRKRELSKCIENTLKYEEGIVRDSYENQCEFRYGVPPSCGNGGTSNPVTSSDPNDIYGYTAESGSHAVKDSLTDVYYRIEFENDTAFATASAHDIYVTDTLDAQKFDLSTFKPTRVRIGEKSAELTGEKNFVTTIDMRPGINAIAQVEGTYDEKKGIARWHISSLDPMTMEPTKYVMDGVLPVNTDGRGLGELSFDISLKPGLTHGTEIMNRAGIVFDQNDVIMTPTWTNTIDREKPTSRVVDATVLPGGETAAISIEAGDDGSGPWHYDVYVQYGSGAWFLAAENVAADTTATVKLYDGIVHRFYSVARDMAGNVEQKEPHSELTLTVSDRQHGDVNGDGKVDVADIAAIISVMAGGSGISNPLQQALRHADANGDGVVDVADIAEVIRTMAALARAAEGIAAEE